MQKDEKISQKSPFEQGSQGRMWIPHLGTEFDKLSLQEMEEEQLLHKKFTWESSYSM